MNTLNATSNYSSSVISDFKNFIGSNRDKINRITPVNPSIDSDQEWLDENIWDDLYNNSKKG